MCIFTIYNSPKNKLFKKSLANIIYLNSEQFCLEFFFEQVNLTPILCIGINNKRRFMSIVKVLLYHFIYTFIFTTIPNDNELVCIPKILSEFLEQLSEKQWLIVSFYLRGRAGQEVRMVFKRGKFISYFRFSALHYIARTNTPFYFDIILRNHPSIFIPSIKGYIIKTAMKLVKSYWSIVSTCWRN